MLFNFHRISLTLIFLGALSACSLYSSSDRVFFESEGRKAIQQAQTLGFSCHESELDPLPETADHPSILYIDQKRIFWLKRIGSQNLILASFQFSDKSSLCFKSYSHDQNWEQDLDQLLMSHPTHPRETV